MRTQSCGKPVTAVRGAAKSVDALTVGACIAAATASAIAGNTADCVSQRRKPSYNRVKYKDLRSLWGKAAKTSLPPTNAFSTQLLVPKLGKVNARLLHDVLDSALADLAARLLKIKTADSALMGLASRSHRTRKIACD